MASLDDFKDEEQVTLTLSDLDGEDVRGETYSPHPVSNMNRAAQAALLSGNPDEVKTLYGVILQELGESPSSPTEEFLLRDKKDRDREATGIAVYDALSSPDITEQEKLAIMDDYANNYTFSKQEELVRENLIGTSSEKMEEAQSVRVGLADMAASTSAYNTELQKVLNAVASGMTGGNVESTAEFLELVTPFTEWNQLRRINRDMFGEEGKASLLSTFWMGQRKKEIRDHLASLQPEERLIAAQKLVEIIQDNNGILLQDENDFATYAALQDLLEGDYTTTDQVIDNITGGLDLLGLGGGVRRLLDLGGSLLSIGRSKAVVGGVQPASSAQILQDTNREKAILAHDSVVQSEGDEIAEALYGSSREDAIVADLVPSIAVEDGSVAARQYNLGREEDLRITPNEDVMDFTSRGGDIHFYKEEKESLRSLVVDNVADSLGIKNRTEMMTVKSTPKGVQISAIYGPTESGFLKPVDAIEHVKYSMRHYGVTDENLTLMQYKDGRYIPVGKEETTRILSENADGNYTVKIDYDYKFNPNDVGKWMSTDVKYNIFDRIPLFAKGSVQRHLMDPASMLDPHITRPASVAVERTAGIEQRMLELGKEFTDTFIKLKDDRKEAVYEYLKRNNREGLAPSISTMKANGFTDSEVAAVHKWKEYWDTQYHLENADLAQNLRNQNYQLLEHSASDTRLIAKPISRQQAGSFVKAYDPISGEVKQFDADDLTKIYESEGSINRLKVPSTFGGDDVIEFVLTDNRPGGTYLRGINDSDSILNYREGYFHVSYDAPWFVDEIIRDGTGAEIYRKAVAVAGTIKEAEHVTSRLRASGKEVEFRPNKKDAVEMDSDDYWSLTTAGRSAQRARGKRLEGADAPYSIIGGNEYILSPVDAMIESAKSISRRVGMRGYLDTIKQRFVAQYGHLIDDSLRPYPGAQPAFPSDMSQLKKKTGPQSDKDIADARSTLEYIHSLENGYANSIDDATKAALRGISDTLGRQGFEIGEKALRKASEGRGPTRGLKSLSFEIYLAMNPLRQAIVQSHQATLLASNFGRYGSDNIALLPKNMGQLAADTTALTLLQMAPKRLDEAAKLSGRTPKEMKKIYEDFKSSGLSAGVSKQSLINDSLSALADQAAYNRNKSLNKQVRLFMQKAGFEVGERFNITSAWLAFRDRAVREGLDLNDEVLDEVTASARNYTYNMNAAGEMPYNQNSLAVMFQFFQVPHKAMLQLTNRQLTKGEKARLLAFQGVMFGMPAAFVYDTFSEVLPDDPETRDKLVMGLEGVMLNSALSAMSDEEVKIDYKSLAPVDMLGTYAFVESLMEGSIPDMVASSPSGQMLFGSNPRIANLVKTVGRYTGAIQDFEDPTTYKMVAEEFFSTFSSGYSNYAKARMAHEYARKMSSIGNVTDKEVNHLEAAMAMLGFRTMDEMKKAYISETAYKKSSAWKEDVTQLYKDVRAHLAKKGVTPEDMEYEAKVITEGWAAFGNDKTAERELFVSLMKKDARLGEEGNMVRNILRIAEMDGGISEARAMVNALPDDYSHQRETLLEAISFIEQQNQELGKQ